MKKFTIYSIIFVLMLSFSFLNAQDKSAYKKTPSKVSGIEQMIVKTNSDIDKNSRAKDYSNYTEDEWDLLLSVDVEAATGMLSAAGAETDGNYIYITKWNGAEIHKFDMDGNFIETFTISGVTGLRDLAYDGTYFYGGAASTTIYEMDFDSKVLVSTISTTASTRAIAYDDDLDGFWVNNWADNVTLVNRDGTTGTSYAGITSQYGMAYDNVTDGGPYLWCFTGTNGAPDPAQLEQFDLATGMYTGVMHSITDDFGSSLAGGLFTHEVDGLYVIGGLNQGESVTAPLTPNTLFVYELATLVQNDHDMALSGFVSPLSGYDLTASEVVEVKIKNKGTVAESGFMVSYSVNGGGEVQETYSGSVAAGDEVMFAFASTADLSEFGDYTIVATVTLAGDQNTGNDSKTTTVVNEPAPSQLTVYPMMVDYWTGTTDGATKTEVSLANTTGGDEEAAWMIFDVSALPPGAEINWVDMSVYVYEANWPYWSITPMGVDPLTADAASIFNEASMYSGTADAYSYNNEASSFGVGWYTYTLGNTANEDLAAAAGGAFAVGLYERDGTNTYYARFEGQAETNVPYLVIDYNVPMDGDAGTVSILVPGQLTPGMVTPKAVVKNFSGNMMSFSVTMTNDGGYTSTKQVTDLAAGQEMEVTFDDWNAAIGNYTFEVCTDAAGDPVPDNNCMTKNVSVSDLTQAYAYVAYDPIGTNPEGPATFFLQSPGDITSLAATTSAQFIGAGAWANGTWYAMEYFDAATSSGGNLYTIDPMTGAMSIVGNTGIGINGIAYDGTTNTLFGIGGGMLYEIDMATGAASEVGATGSVSLMIGLACSGDGTLYTYSLDDEFFSIDKNTGAVTLIGPIGFDANYAQDMEFDLNSGTLYLAAYNLSTAGELRTVDIATGASTFIGDFMNGSEICGFAIPGEAGPVSGFMADIDVMDNGGAKTANSLTIGTADDATDGLDAQYNELELPPVPPAGVFDSRLILPGGTMASTVDIRNTDNEEIVWTMKFQPGDGGYPFTFSWDPMDLPDGSFMLVDNVTGGMVVNVDMKANDMYELTNSAIGTLEIRYSEAMTMQFEMLMGWNIVSVPVMAPDMAVGTLFPDATSDAFAFDNGYTAVTDLEGGAGYWLKMPAAGSHSVTGMAMSDNVSLNAGWNIIGPYHYEMDVANITTNPAGIIVSDFFGFEAGYYSATGIAPGHGYWVKASAAGEIVMSMGKRGDDIESVNEDPMYTIDIATNDGAAGSYALALGIDPLATDGIDSDLGETELPPLPPAGVYDARLILGDNTTGTPKDYRAGDNNFTGQVTYKLNWQPGDGATALTLDVNVPQVPGTVTVTVKDVILNGGIVNVVLNEGVGQVVVTNLAVTSLNIIVDYNAPIPVELTSFAANVVGETIQLAWETATETNNKGFEVERSSDNETFTQVGKIDGHGTTAEKQSYNFTDHNATSGTYYYRLRQVDFDGTSTYSDVVEVEFIPTEYSLGQNYPNPFNPSTKVKFAVPVESKVTVTLYNMLGQKVKELVAAQYNVGLHEVELNASDLASGMYIYSITAQGVDGSNFVDTKKMMLMK